MKKSASVILVFCLVIFLLSSSFAEDRLVIKDSGGNATFTVSDEGEIFTSSSDGLHVYGESTSDLFAGMGTDLYAGPAFNFGYAGYSLGRSAGFFNVRPDASAVYPNPSLRFMTQNIQRMIVTGDGRVGIGTSNPATSLHVAGIITEDSDVRLKKNILPIKSALKKILQLQGVSFEWKDGNNHDGLTNLGVIAQDVQKIFPEVVFASDDEMRTLSVNYDGMIAPLIEAVKELNVTIETLKNDLTNLRTEMKRIKAQQK